MVDPREEKPSQRELEMIYEEQIQRQKVAVERVHKIEKVIHATTSGIGLT